MPDPFSNVTGIPVGQDPENLALTVARSGAARSGATRSGFIGSPGDSPDLHDIGTDGSIVGAGYGWRDRHLPPPPVIPQNQPPVITLPSDPQTANAAALTLSVAGGNPITLADVDANGGTEQMDILASGGRIFMGTLGPIIVTGGGENTTHITFTGTVDEINTAMDGMSLANLANGSYTLIFTANDLGNTGAGGPKTDQKTLHVTAINMGH